MKSYYIPHVSITPRYIATYALPERTRVRSKAERENQKNLEETEHNGKISKKANRRIRKAIDWMVFRAKPKSIYPRKKHCRLKFRLNFITLTLSAKQEHSDLEIKKELLQPFLNYARKVWKVEDYLWRAEAQRNGNIHFHIITDRYIEWSEIRNQWNKYQAKLGYIRRFNEKYSGKTPNSTDVHSINKINDLAAYLSKYVAKNGKNRAINGKNWGLSYKISRIKSVVELECGQISEELNKIWRILKPKQWKDRYVQVMYVKIEEWKSLGCEILERLVAEHLAVDN